MSFLSLFSGTRTSESASNRIKFTNVKKNISFEVFTNPHVRPIKDRVLYTLVSFTVFFHLLFRLKSVPSKKMYDDQFLVTFKHMAL